MDIGESIGIAVVLSMEEASKCPLEHTDPVKIKSQPAIHDKSSQRLQSNMTSGKGTRLEISIPL